MTISQLTSAMEFICPGVGYSFQLDPAGRIEWIRLEGAGVCPTPEEIEAAIPK